jgi:hypothetical protein
LFLRDASVRQQHHWPHGGLYQSVEIGIGRDLGERLASLAECFPACFCEVGGRRLRPAASRDGLRPAPRRDLQLRCNLSEPTKRDRLRRAVRRSSLLARGPISPRSFDATGGRYDGLYMATLAETLIDVAKSVAPEGGFFGYYDLVDALNDNPAAFERFKSTLSTARVEDLEGISKLDKQYGWIVMGAADALDLLPDDPRLFKSEADVAALPDNKVLGALCSACIVNDVATVGRLVKRCDVNKLDHNGQTPLCYAVGNNHGECVRVLLDNAASPNRVQNWGNTALHICASTVSSKDIFRMLLAAGGDVSIRNERGESALDLLEKHGRRDWIAV